MHGALLSMVSLRQISVPHVIRLKPGALTRISTYLERENLQRALLLQSEGLPEEIAGRLETACRPVYREEVRDNAREWLDLRRPTWQGQVDVVIGVGGGKALDIAKLAAYELDLPYLAAPTSLSNDGFCSPQASLTSGGRRTTSPARLPWAVVVDLEVVARAPLPLWLSGVGDLVSKWTAVHDWKLAFHRDGTPFDDLAALLSDASVSQFLAHPQYDTRGVKLLAQALLFNGVAMEMAGCSRPASGSEHLISHALDLSADSPRLHGLQVGLATYWMAQLQGQDPAPLDLLFERCGFWRHWEQHPMPRREWLQALDIAPTIKQHFFTVLDQPEAREKAARLLISDARLVRCLI